MQSTLKNSARALVGIVIATALTASVAGQVLPPPSSVPEPTTSPSQLVAPVLCGDEQAEEACGKASVADRVHGAFIRMGNGNSTGALAHKAWSEVDPSQPMDGVRDDAETFFCPWSSSGCLVASWIQPGVIRAVILLGPTVQQLYWDNWVASSPYTMLYNAHVFMLDGIERDVEWAPGAIQGHGTAWHCWIEGLAEACEASPMPPLWPEMPPYPAPSQPGS